VRDPSIMNRILWLGTGDASRRDFCSMYRPSLRLAIISGTVLRSMIMDGCWGSHSLSRVPSFSLMSRSKWIDASPRSIFSTTGEHVDDIASISFDSR